MIIPAENMQSILQEVEGIEIIPVRRLEEVFSHVFGEEAALPNDAIPAAADRSETKSV